MKRKIGMFKKLCQAALPLVAASVALAGCALQGSAAGSAPVRSAEPAAALPQAAALPPDRAAGSPAAELLYVTGTDDRGISGLFALDPASGAVRRTLPPGYITPDWSTLFEVAPGRDRTAIRAYDLASGKLLRETTVSGLYDVPAPPEDPRQRAFSQDGRLLALFGRPTAAEERIWNQTGKPPSTRILVLDTSFKSSPRRVDLAGYFWFDTLGTDSLYLIEVLANDPGHEPRYHVRRYDLAAGQLDEYPVVDKREPGPMNGSRMVAVPSSDGTWLYSLYIRQGAGPFIHILNLKERFAVCVDLPFGSSKGDFESELLWSLALSPDQKTLYAVNGALGQAAAMDTVKFEVRSAKLPTLTARAPSLLARIGSWLVPAAEAKRLVVGGAAVSPDGQVLYAVEDQGLAAIATSDLTLEGRYMAGLPLSSLALSPNGSALYAASAEKPSLLRLELPLTQGGGAPDEIATQIRPETVMRVISER